MYSKQEAYLLRQEFWTSFGQYMSLHLSADGEKINWINFKTGEKNIYFKMNADNKNASIAIELTHTSPDIREIYFQQFEEFKKLFHNTLGEEWIWNLHDADENGRHISRIFTTVQGVSVFNKADWPAIISFFKPRIIALDEFWSSVKYAFELLR